MAEGKHRKQQHRFFPFPFAEEGGSNSELQDRPASCSSMANEEQFGDQPLSSAVQICERNADEPVSAWNNSFVTALAFANAGALNRGTLFSAGRSKATNDELRAPPGSPYD
jgi:hypothetical protein